jgi:predicted metal-dependent hydrolase
MNPYLQDMLHNITTRLAKLEEAPPSLLDSVYCQCGASWKYKDGELDYKPSTKKKEWVGLTQDDIYKISEKCGLMDAAWEDVMNAIEAKLKDKNDN